MVTGNFTTPEEFSMMLEKKASKVAFYYKTPAVVVVVVVCIGCWLFCILEPFLNFEMIPPTHLPAMTFAHTMYYYLRCTRALSYYHFYYRQQFYLQQNSSHSSSVIMPLAHGRKNRFVKKSICCNERKTYERDNVFKKK